MNNEQLTQAVQDALAQAQGIAQVRKHQEIDIAHLFKFLIQPGEMARDIYHEAGVDVAKLETEIDRQLDQIAVVEGNVSYGQNLSSNLYALLQAAEKLRQEFGDDFIAVDTLLVALMTLKCQPLSP